MLLGCGVGQVRLVVVGGLERVCVVRRFSTERKKSMTSLSLANDLFGLGPGRSRAPQEGPMCYGSKDKRKR